MFKLRPICSLSPVKTTLRKFMTLVSSDKIATVSTRQVRGPWTRRTWPETFVFEPLGSTLILRGLHRPVQLMRPPDIESINDTLAMVQWIAGDQFGKRFEPVSPIRLLSLTRKVKYPYVCIFTMRQLWLKIKYVYSLFEKCDINWSELIAI